MSKPPQLEKTLAILKKAGARGMFISELAKAADITPTTVNRYAENRTLRDRIKVEKRGGLKFVYWIGK
jgi:AcrR family transcriptional regulator